MKPFWLDVRGWAVTLVMIALVPLGVSCAKKAPKPSPLTRGTEAYLMYCAMCHGELGEGNGPLAAALADEHATTPAKLNDPQRIAALGKKEIERVITEGGLHTGRSGLMPAWGTRLDSTLIDDIATFVMTLPSQRPGTPSKTIRDFLASPPGSSEDGRRLYVNYCAICHGPEGKGNGFYADTLYARNGIRPRNLTDTDYFKNKTDQELYVTIALGGGHGGKSVFMPEWDVTLKPEQMKSLISYVRAISHTQSK